MKYIVLKNSLSFLCVQLPEGFGTKLEIICFENQTEFDEYLKENKASVCLVSFAQPTSEKDKYTDKSLHQQDGFFVRHNNYYKKVLFSDVMWVQAARSYCCIQTTGKTNFIVTYPLSEVKKKLPPTLFIQTHRSFLVNMKLVDKFISNALYIGEHTFPISRKFKKNVLDHFSFLDNIKETLGKETKLPRNKIKTENDIKLDYEDL